MEYIKPEEFLKQPQKIQDTLLDWWQPNVGDLIYNFKFNAINFLNGDFKNISKIHKELLLKFSIPLLTEGQLRNFIEDKVGGNISCELSLEGYYVAITDFDTEGMYFEKKHWLTESYDLLQAYWKVVCKIVKEG